MDEERPDGVELWQLIEALTEDVKRGQADIAALISRADVADAVRGTRAPDMHVQQD